MSFSLTPHALAAAYEYLRTTPPFKGWKLPPADAVEFVVTLHRDRDADHELVRPQEHMIRVSMRTVRTTDAVMQAIAHEMIHAYQDGVTCTGTRAEHNKEFHRLAARVCNRHGWILDGFIDE